MIMPGQRGSEKRKLIALPILVRLDQELANVISAAANAQDLTPASWLRLLAVQATGADQACIAPARSSLQPPPASSAAVIELAELRHVTAELGGALVQAAIVSREAGHVANHIAIEALLPRIKAAADAMDKAKLIQLGRSR
jgi:hypothetical protein